MASNGRPKALDNEMFDDAMDLSGADNGDNLDFHDACLEEIDRYRRMDEWIPSYNNVLSITSLDCKRRLVQAGAADLNLADFLQYTRDGTSDELRLYAFEAMMDLGLIRQEKLFRWFLIVLGTDPSPYLREHMMRLFGKILAALAIGEISFSRRKVAVESDGLIIEDTSTDARKKEMDRTKTVTGALEALKEDIGRNETLRRGLWAAISSPAISLREMGDLIEICSLLYNPNSTLIVKLKYPRYWNCRKNGKVRSRLLSQASNPLTIVLPQLIGQAFLFTLVTHSNYSHTTASTSCYNQRLHDAEWRR